MDKVLVSDLMKETFRRSALISIPHITDLLDLNDDITKYEIFYTIVKNALQTYERYYPLYTTLKIYLEFDGSKRFKFIDNFEGYLNGKVSEEHINLIPSAVIGIANNPNMANISVLRTWRYNPPYLYDFWYTGGIYWVSIITNRPIFEEYDQVTKKFTDRCAVYYLTKDVGSQYKIFMDQVYVETCRYIINLKKNMNIQNLPIELFQGLEDDYQKVSGELENHYQNSLTSGQYII